MSQPNSQNISTTLGIGDYHVQISNIKNEHRFYFFVILAFLIHTSLLITTTSLKPRRLGTVNGSDNAISVSLINTKDLLSKATVDDQSAGVQSPTVAQQKKLEKQTEPQQSSHAEEANPKILKDTKSQTKRNEGDRQFHTDDIEKNNSTQGDMPTKTSNENKITEQKVKPQNQENKKIANLDLTQPQIFTSPTGGGGAGVQRPPGITRSGENDDFARGVIRALQQTMPQLTNTFGRVTVRIVLDKNGSLVTTDVIKPSQVGGLDQSVVFATRQSSFPLPPLNANSADLTFFITYIYR